MKLPGGRVDEFARLIGRPDWGGLIQPKNYWKCRVVIEDGVMVAGTMVATDEDGWSLVGLGGRAEDLPELLQDVFDLATRKGRDSLRVRVQKERLTPEFRGALEESGFRQTEERVRYRRMLDGTFVEGEGRLVWRDLGAVGFDAAAAVMDRVAEGDPGHDPSERADEALRFFLNDSVLTKGPDVVEIGYHGEEPVAFVCAQVNPRTKWGRITYIGVVPKHRGNRFGREVHRHGLAMLLRQGCKLYEGGTDVANRPMQSLFERNECEKFGHEFGFTWRNTMKN